MKKSRIASLLLALALVMGLSIPAFAEGKEEDTSAHLEIEDGTAHQVKPLSEDASGKGWSYDAGTYTLTLSGFEGQYVRVYYAKQPFTMVLADGTSNHFSFGFSAKTDAGFTIKGGGSLDISGNPFGDIDLGDTLTIESGTITTQLRAFLNGGKLHMKGGSLSLAGEYYGILGSTYDYTDAVTISGGTITLQGGRAALELSRPIASGPITTGLENAAFTGADGAPLTLKVADEGASHFARLYDAAGNVATYAVITPSGAPVLPEDPAQPEADTAYATAYSILVDGQAVDFDAYALKDENGNDTNYLKLRDVAHVLNGSRTQFQVGWDGAANAISITTGQAYTPNGSEMSTPFSGDRAYAPNQAAVLVDGAEAGLDAITLTDDAGNGYTYFKLRDLGQAIDFNVTWDGESSSIVIDTTQPYQG